MKPSSFVEGLKKATEARNNTENCVLFRVSVAIIYDTRIEFRSM